MTKKCINCNYSIQDEIDQIKKIIKKNKILQEQLGYTNRPQCCIDHNKYYSTCDNCEYGEDDE